MTAAAKKPPARAKLIEHEKRRAWDALLAHERDCSLCVEHIHRCPIGQALVDCWYAIQGVAASPSRWNEVDRMYSADGAEVDLAARATNAEARGTIVEVR